MKNEDSNFLKAGDIDIDWIPTHEIVAGLQKGGGAGLRVPDTYEQEATDMAPSMRMVGALTRKQLIKLFLHEILQRDVMIGKLATALGSPEPMAPAPPAPPPDEPRIMVPDSRLVVAR